MDDIQYWTDIVDIDVQRERSGAVTRPWTRGTDHLVAGGTAGLNPAVWQVPKIDDEPSLARAPEQRTHTLLDAAARDTDKLSRTPSTGLPL